jgi:hypothetical protein
MILFLSLGPNDSLGQALKSSPPQGSIERARILDAIRSAIRTDVTFKVSHLVVLENLGKVIALADVVDSSKETETGGIFLLNLRNGRWQTLAMVGGTGGSHDCSTVRPILKRFVIELQSLDISIGELPPSFIDLLTEALVADADEQCSTAKIFADNSSTTAANVPNNSSDDLLHFVDGTQPPDAWLALRTEPGPRGARISQLPNGTLIEVLERRTDNWWRVRVVEIGIEGWILHKSGSRTWVSCCRLVR